MQKNRSVQPLPIIFVDRNLVNDRITNYQTIKHPILDTALKNISDTRQETKSIWYSREHFESILSEMDLTDADGVRIYFGAYGEEESIAPGQLCLMMVLTRTVSPSTNHSDIVYENEPDFEDRSNASRSLSCTVNDSEGPRQFNYGSPCPPICVNQDPEFPQE